MLTPEQIDYLFAFCEKKMVRYYDVQLEIVDHLTEAIESKMKKDNSLSFENALAEVYKSFGIFGFSHIVREKQTNVGKQQSKIFKSIVKDQFKWPKLVLFISSLFLFFLLFRKIGYYGVWFSAIGIMVLALGVITYTGFKMVRLRKTRSKKLLIAQYFYNTELIYLPFYFFWFSGNFEWPNGILLGTSVSLSLLYAILISGYIIILIANLQTYWAVEYEIKKSYPEIFLAKQLSSPTLNST